MSVLMQVIFCCGGSSAVGNVSVWFIDPVLFRAGCHRRGIRRNGYEMTMDLHRFDDPGASFLFGE